MIRLGHIVYSNCFPVHAALLAEPLPSGVELHTGVPSQINRALAMGAIDVAPCSSIEYARHADHYCILPGLVIGSDGPVQSIRFDTRVAPEQLNGETVYVTDSSATSVVLLRILLERYWGVSPSFETFDQTSTDPLGDGAAAALFIGDVALRRTSDAAAYAFDLGEQWRNWTGLPFAFAVWQARTDTPAQELARLHYLLLESRAYFGRHSALLAKRFAGDFAMEPDRLLRYWQSLRYDLDERMRQGLLHFLALAAELGEAPPVPQLDFVPV
jgi:chorismate dehydratase